MSSKKFSNVDRPAFSCVRVFLYQCHIHGSLYINAMSMGHFKIVIVPVIMGSRVAPNSLIIVVYYCFLVHNDGAAPQSISIVSWTFNFLRLCAKVLTTSPEGVSSTVNI